MRGVAADVHAEVSVDGDVVGQIAIGNNILQIGSLHGDLVMAASPGSVPKPVLRPSPVKVVPRRPKPFFGRRAETTLLVTEANAGRAITVEGSAGIGRSTLLRRVATDDALHSVTHVSRLTSSLDDAAQVVFDHFYHCDVPIRPTAAQMRLLLQQVRAAVVIDDMPTDTVRGLLDLAPNCGFVLATDSPVAGVRSVTLGGLAADESRELFAYGLGRALGPGEHDDADRICVFAGNSPTRIIATSAAARASDRSLGAFADDLWASNPTSALQPTEHDARLIDLLAAVPDLVMPPSWLSTLAQVPDVAVRLERWIAGGQVREIPDAGYQMVAGRTARPDARADVIAYAAHIARMQRAPITPGPTTDALHAMFTDCTLHGDWQAVLEIGAALDPVYAQSGRWDAWRDVLTPMLNAARTLGNRAAEARALHQLGTRELCLLSMGTAAGLLAVALRIRQKLGDTAGTEATRHNMSLIPPGMAPEAGHQPHPTHFRPRVKAAAIAGTAVMTTLTTTAAIVLTTSPPVPAPRPSVSFTAATLLFPPQAVSTPGEVQIATLINDGQTAAHITAPRTVGANATDFEATATTCGTDLPPGESCDTTVAFIPSAEGARTASLAIEVDGAGVTAVVLAGAGSTPTGLIVDPTTLDFGEQPLHTSSQPQKITVTHPDPSTTTLGQVVVDGTAATQFTLVNDTCSGQQMTNTDSCIVDVNFAPGSTGPQVARLQIVADDGSVADSVPLSGAGQPPPANRPDPPTHHIVAVPPVVGEPVETARAQLTAAGLRVGNVVDEPDDSAPTGRVIRSSPLPGTEVEPGTVIGLVTSSGPPTCVVPDVTGQGLETAKANIQATCAVVGAVAVRPIIEGPTEVVIQTSPEPGARITDGDAVQLVVTKDGTHVPDVEGMSLSEAKALIEEKGLKVGKVTGPDTDGSVVIKFNPQRGKLVELGSSVDLTLKEGTPKDPDEDEQGSEG